MIATALIAMAMIAQPADTDQAASGNAAAAASTPLEPGQERAHPWDVPLMPGDTYATAVLSVDKRGYPTNCGLKDTNVHDRETIFFICKAMMDGWHTQPLTKDGVAVAGTVERKFMMRGRQGERAVEESWRRYKAAHPEAKRPD